MKRRVRRQRVSLRVKLQRENGRRRFGLVVFVALAAAAGYALSKADIGSWRAQAAAALTYRSVEAVGVPEGSRARMLELTARPPAWGGEAAFAETLAAAFPELKLAGVRRRLIARRLEIAWSQRTPLVRFSDGRVLAREGGLFRPAQAEGGVPLVELAGAAAENADGPALAAAFEALEKSGLPKPARIRLESGGWRLVWEDGTEAAWGETGRADDKAARLAEVLKDARRRFPARIAADLRFFDDGRVIVRGLR